LSFWVWQPPLPLDRPGSKSLEEAPVPLGASSIFMTEVSEGLFGGIAVLSGVE
jgi:hypothetical protein